MSETRIAYELWVEVDMSLMTSVSDVVTSVNECMAGFGFNDKILLLSKAPICTITANRELSDMERQEIMNYYLKCVEEQPLLKGKITVLELKRV